MATVQILVDDVDVTADVEYETARFTAKCNGVAGEAGMRVRDDDSAYSFPLGADWLLLVDGEAAWRGFVRQAKRVYLAPAENVAESGLQRYIDLVGSDVNLLFSTRFASKSSAPQTGPGPTYAPGTADTTAISALVSDWIDLSSDAVDTTSGVTGVGSLDPAQPTQAWGGGTMWGDAMATIAYLPAAIWYLRPEVGPSPRSTLVYCDADTATAPFGLSDQPEVPGVPAVVTWTADVIREWTPDTAYSRLSGDCFGQVFQPGSDHSVIYTTSTPAGGTSGSSEPAWNPSGTTTDNDITWDANPTSDVVPAWSAGDYYRTSTVQPTAPNGHTYTVLTADPDAFTIPSGYPEPTWPTSGTVDEDVVTQPGGDPGTKGYREVEVTLDGTALANDALIWGQGYGSTQTVFSRTTDSGSLLAHGRWQYGDVRGALYKQSSADRISASIVNGSPENHRGGKDDRPQVTVTTYEPGLLAGHVVDFSCNAWSYYDTIPIREVEITFEAPADPKYKMLLSFDIDSPWLWNDYPWWKLPGMRPPPGIPGIPPVPSLPPVTECGITDTYTRSVAEGWGTSDSGIAWAVTADTSYVDGQGHMSSLSESAAVIGPLTLTGPMDAQFEVTPGGATYVEARITVPGLDYQQAVRLDLAASTVTATMQGPTSGPESTSADFTFSGSTAYVVGISYSPTSLSAKVWPLSTSVPPDWTVTHTYTGSGDIPSGESGFTLANDSAATGTAPTIIHATAQDFLLSGSPATFDMVLPWTPTVGNLIVGFSNDGSDYTGASHITAPLPAGWSSYAGTPYVPTYPFRYFGAMFWKTAAPGDGTITFTVPSGCIPATRVVVAEFTPGTVIAQSATDAGSGSPDMVPWYATAHVDLSSPSVGVTIFGSSFNFGVWDTTDYPLGETILGPAGGYSLVDSGHTPPWEGDPTIFWYVTQSVFWRHIDPDAVGTFVASTPFPFSAGNPGATMLVAIAGSGTPVVGGSVYDNLDITGVNACREGGPTLPGQTPGATGFACIAPTRSSSTVYTVTDAFSPSSTLVWVAGLYLRRGTDYTEASDGLSITLATGVDATVAVRVCYIPLP